MTEYHSPSILSTSLSGSLQSPMRFVTKTTLGLWSGRRPQLERWLQFGVPATPQVRVAGTFHALDDHTGPVAIVLDTEQTQHAPMKAEGSIYECCFGLQPFLWQLLGLP